MGLRSGLQNLIFWFIIYLKKIIIIFKKIYVKIQRNPIFYDTRLWIKTVLDPGFATYIKKIEVGVHW